MIRPQLHRYTRYQFVFFGEIADDKSIDDVKTSLKSDLKISQDQCKKLFNGKRIVVKKEIHEEEAKRYQALFMKAGALGSVEPMPQSTASQTSVRGRSSPQIVLRVWRNTWSIALPS